MKVGENKTNIRFKGALVDFTGYKDRCLDFHLNPSAKDLIESSGVPHVEVFGLLVNGEPAPLSYNVSDGDSIEVFPNQMEEDSEYPRNIRQAEELPVAFVADVHLGKTTRYLRLMGIDTLYNNTAEDADIVELAKENHRAALSRDLGLLKHGDLEYGYWLRSTVPKIQLREIIKFFDLQDHFRPFTRCMNCNGHLEAVSKQEVKDQLPINVKETFDDFMQCTSCGQVYWKGSHYEKLVSDVEEILDAR